MKTTFQKIKDNNPCSSGWKKLIGYYKPESLTEEVSFEEILKSNGIKYAVWSLRVVEDKKSIMLFCADIAESVLDIYFHKYPENKAPRECINAVHLFVEGKITREELLEKRSDADAAAYAAYADAADAAAYAADAAAYAADAAAYAAAAAAYAAADAAAAAAADAKWKEVTESFIKYFK